MTPDIHITLIGFAVGTLVGLTGIGGSSILAPLLVLVLGVKPSIAIGTDLLYSVPTKLLAFALHARQGTVDWPLTRGLLFGGVPGALVGLGAYGVLRAHLDAPTLENALRHAIGITILLACVGATLTWALRARKGRVGASDATPRFVQIPVNCLHIPIPGSADHDAGNGGGHEDAGGESFEFLGV